MSEPLTRELLAEDILFVLQSDYEGWTAQEVNSGECAFLADAISQFHPEEVRIVSDDVLGGEDYTDYYHSFIEFQGRYYDAEVPYGVDRWQDLPIFARVLRELEAGGHKRELAALRKALAT